MTTSDPCCLNHADERKVKIGSVFVSNYSEAWRLHCERELVRKMKPKQRRLYLDGVERKRGLAGFELLIGARGV